MTELNTFWNAEVYERIGKPMREWSRAERKLARQVSCDFRCWHYEAS